MILRLCAVLALCVSALSFPMTALQRHLASKSKTPTPPLKNGPYWYDRQVLDHFKQSDQRVWSQRYFMSPQYYDNTTGVVFLQLGGEGAIDDSYTSEFQYVKYAQTHKAYLVALEHRFFGMSKPLPDLTTDSLQYLNSDQAMADAAQFLEYFLTEVEPTAKHVVTFGCSYSGALSSWFRQKFPHKTIGAVDGSGPVHATLDFYQYLDSVEMSLDYFAGQMCVDRVSNATAQVQTLLKTAQGQQVAAGVFNTCSVPTKPEDIATFAQNLMGNWMGVVQYNHEIKGRPDINTLCAIMNDTSLDPLEAYVKVNDLFVPQGDCMPVSYADQVKQMQNLTQPETGVGIRAWVWMTCTEFGWYQTTDSAAQPFGDLVPLEYSLQLCRDVYDFPTNYNFTRAMEQTNDKYGSTSPSTENVVFVDGTIDPWRAMSVTKQYSEASPVILITGTAHCDTSFPYIPGFDPVGKATAFKTIDSVIGTWISDAQKQSA